MPNQGRSAPGAPKKKPLGPELLYVRCKECGAAFRSPIQMNRASLEGSVLAGNSYQCPAGHNAIYEKRDHFFAREQSS